MEVNIENPLYPLDLNIFNDHIKYAFGNILDKVIIFYFS